MDTTVTYDTEDQVVAVADDAGETTAYLYDTAGRLKQMTLPGGTGYGAYDLDPAGNRLKLTVQESVPNSAAVTYTVDYGYNRLGQKIWSKRAAGTSDESESRSWYDSLGYVPRTARYLDSGLLPSELSQPRSWRTRKDPFEEAWPWIGLVRGAASIPAAWRSPN